MINAIKDVIHKLFAPPRRAHGMLSPTAQSSAYSEMVSNDLEKKYEGRSFTIPIQFINFDAIIQSLSMVGHEALQLPIEKPYTLEDFDDVNPEIAEVVTDYLNTRIKLMINSMMQDFLERDIIKMSADAEGVKYYSEEEDEDAAELIELERNFRGI